MGEQQIFALLKRVRARWRRLAALRAVTRAALGVAVIFALAAATTRLVSLPAGALAAMAMTAAVLAMAAACWAFWPVRERPSDARVARFIEESNPALEDRLVSAVSAARDTSRTSPFALTMIADAVKRTSTIAPSDVIGTDRLRTASVQAFAALALLVALVVAGRVAAREWYDALLQSLFAGVSAENAPANAAEQPPAPRVTRIDLAYTFPKELGLPPRSEEDSGDVYAPAGTLVRVTVHTDRDVPGGRIAFGNGSSLDLEHEAASRLSTKLTVTEDGSYRVALAGASAPGTEYFIRILEDRPPNVHVIRPARDREVTRLEEVEIEARADDDFGLASMELVYAVNGGAEHSLPFSIAPHALSADGARTLFLEDMSVAPGDFVSYYVRARDIGRGKRSSETRSDLFFLQVRPFDQTFRLASSQGSGTGKGSDIDGLVQAQKDIIVSTWKLDRRGQAAGATSADDVRAVGKAESELKTRVEELSSSFRETTLRDPRARAVPRAAAPGEPAMTAAAASLGKAAETLDALKTAEAVSPEMDALNHLLQAQAEVTEREVQTQQAANGTVSNRSNLDLTNLFDRELQRQQRTNYESKPGAGQQGDTSALDKIQDLARRQDELNRRQQELAQKRNQMPSADVQRQLQQLAREQADLRREVEQLDAQSNGSTGSTGSQNSRASQGSPQSSQEFEAAKRAAADAMQGAANSLRQQNPAGASQQSEQASRALRELARQVETGSGSAAGKPQAGDPREDAEARRLSDDRAQAEALRKDLEKIAGEMKQAGNANDAARLSAEAARDMQRAQQLLEELKRDDPTVAQGGLGFTFEGQGMTLSAPGTEAFKQDLSKWDQLRLQASDALSRAESSIERKLQAQDTKNRLPAGADDRAPAAYQSQVNSYFKSLADRK